MALSQSERRLGAAGFRVIPDGSSLLDEVESRLPEIDSGIEAPEVIVASASSVVSGTVSPEDRPEALWLIVDDVEGEVKGLNGVMYKFVEANVDKVVEAAGNIIRVFRGVDSMFRAIKARKRYGVSALS
jgi:hypothetical protein